MPGLTITMSAPSARSSPTSRKASSLLPRSIWYVFLSALPRLAAEPPTSREGPLNAEGALAEVGLVMVGGVAIYSRALAVAPGGAVNLADRAQEFPPGA